MSDPRAIRAARIASYREMLRHPLTQDDRADLRWKLDSLLRLQACDAPLTQEEINYAAVVSGEALRMGGKREAEGSPAPALGLIRRG